MVATLAFRHLWVKKLRALFLLFGYALGAGVMIVLLSVGEAMLEQSRDVSLVGGGEVTVLPQGIDIEAMRTGGVGGMFFGIDRARFVARQLLGGPRHAALVRAVSPAIENKLLYVRFRGTPVAARVGGEIPSHAVALAAGLRVTEGLWRDSPADSAYLAPSNQRLYDELDRFHLPPVSDSTWAEWEYFNIVASPQEWWYLTFLVGGRIPDGAWGGQLLVSHRRPDGRYQRFSRRTGSAATTFDTTGADLTIGSGSVRQSDGVYRLRLPAESGLPVSFDLSIQPTPQRYFPPVILSEGEQLSGYVVPALAATASGRICLENRCRELRGAAAYHDHNWGVWREVTWDWGSAGGHSFNLLYGGVHRPDTTAGGGAPPIFFALVDSLGVRQVLRSREIRYSGARAVPNRPGVTAPAAFDLVAARDQDTLRLRVKVEDVQATAQGAGGLQRYFLQMRGRFVLEGRLSGAGVADSGRGFFETYVNGER